MTKERLKIGEKWKLPLTRLQIEELDKMIDFYSLTYKKKKMREKILFKVQIMVAGEPADLDKIEAKLLNLTKKEEVVSFHISKYYQ